MTFYPEDVLVEIITSLCKDTKTKEAAILALEAYPSIEMPEEFGEFINPSQPKNRYIYNIIRDWNNCWGFIFPNFFLILNNFIFFYILRFKRK